MDEVTDSAAHLMKLFEHRDKMAEQCTRKIVRFLAPLLNTLGRMLNSTEETFSVKNVFVDDGVLGITFSLAYNPNEPMTPFLKLLHITTPDVAVKEVQRVLTLGIPVATVFGEQEELERWLMKIARETFDPDATAVPEKTEVELKAPEPAKETTSFDPSQLTADQAAQLLYFQQHTKGIKQ